MNIQAIMKQAQTLEKEMKKQEEELSKTTFLGESSLVKITMRGNYSIEKVEINKDENLSGEDLEILEDMIVAAFNDAIGKIEKVKEEKLGKFAKIPGLF